MFFECKWPRAIAICAIKNLAWSSLNLLTFTKCLNNSPPLNLNWVIINLLDEFHDEINTEVVLEDVLHVYYEWMLYCIQNVFLQLYVLELFIINNDVLSDAFHGINLFISIMLYQVYFSKCAFSDHTQYYKILEFRFRYSDFLRLTCKTSSC